MEACFLQPKRSNYLSILPGNIKGKVVNLYFERSWFQNTEPAFFSEQINGDSL